MALVARKRKNSITYYSHREWRGRDIWEHLGTDKRMAQRRDREIAKELRAGTYQVKVTGAALVRTYAAEWFTRQTNRTADDEQRWWDRHVAARCPWFMQLRLEDVRTHHVLKVLRDLAEPFTSDSKYTRTTTVLPDGRFVLSPKSISNLHGVLTRIFRDAQLEELIFRDPCRVPKGTINRRTRRRKPYAAEHVIALTTDDRIQPADRMLLALLFYTGMREGEGCGLRWRDWDRAPEPLTALVVSKQYGGELMKTERDFEGEATRWVPVHPELERALEEWWRTGFEMTYCRKPTLDDFIVPCRARHRNGQPYAGRFLSHHTKSSAYKLFARALRVLGIESQTLHATRNTFISFARRVPHNESALEKITHNAKGEVIDVYTEHEWATLCEVVEGVKFVARKQRVPLRHLHAV